MDDVLEGQVKKHIQLTETIFQINNLSKQVITLPSLRVYIQVAVAIIYLYEKNIYTTHSTLLFENRFRFQPAYHIIIIR